MAVSFERCRQVLPCDAAPQTVDWDSLLASIRDAWYSEPEDTEKAYRLLSTLLLFSEWRSPPPVNLIRNSFYCGLMVEIFSSLRCHRCQGQALRLICFALDKYPETLHYFRSADLITGLFTFLEFVGSMQQPMRDIAPFYVISCIAQFASAPQGVPLILDDIDNHESFFGQVLRLLDGIICECSEEPHEPLYPQKTEAKIYELFQNIAQWPDLNSDVYDVIFSSYSRVFEMERFDSYPDVIRALKFLWFARPACRDKILDPRISKPVCVVVSSIASLNAIPAAIGLVFGFLAADRTFSADLDPHALFEIAQRFAEEEDATTDTALQVLGEKFSVDGGDWPDFPFGDLLGFCCAQFSDERLCFRRKVGTAFLVLSMLATAGSGVFGEELSAIAAAFDVAESGSPDLIGAAIAAADSALGDAARQRAGADPRVLDAIRRFLEAVDGAGSADECEQALELLGRMAAGGLLPEVSEGWTRP